jgi:hypothetical protein
MSYSQLLAPLGFAKDSFAKTNADEEYNLTEYFVPPPFFSAVFGDPESPKSSMVFAPRGGFVPSGLHTGIHSLSREWCRQRHS